MEGQPRCFDALLGEEAATEQRELPALSSDGRLVVADTSGHNIALEQPELVLDGVRTMLEQLASD